MTTKFQKKLMNDLDTLWGIVKIYHPDIPEHTTTNKGEQLNVKEKKLSAYLKYDWVCIDFRVKGYGLISIGVDNCNQTGLFGPRISKQQMSKALRDGTCSIRTWRFSLDSKYKSFTPEKGSWNTRSEAEEALDQKAVELLTSKGYGLQSVDEMFQIYYED
jgi:hypothetical protein